MPRQGRKYPRLGEQIDRLVLTLVAIKSQSMTATMTYIAEHTHYGRDMVYRWRQGAIRPSDEVLEILTEIGKKDTSLPREWGESMLNAAGYMDTANLVNSLWGVE